MVRLLLNLNLWRGVVPGSDADVGFIFIDIYGWNKDISYICLLLFIDEMNKFYRSIVNPNIQGNIFIIFW